ncbi:MAG: hypothetical protein VXZ38_08795 [Planctomycetota bacterium]|nr:hypothetical protein [Planctomycetota bacterium]
MKIRLRSAELRVPDAQFKWRQPTKSSIQATHNLKQGLSCAIVSSVDLLPRLALTLKLRQNHSRVTEKWINHVAVEKHPIRSLFGFLGTAVL